MMRLKGLIVPKSDKVLKKNKKKKKQKKTCKYDICQRNTEANLKKKEIKS